MTEKQIIYDEIGDLSQIIDKETRGRPPIEKLKEVINKALIGATHYETEHIYNYESGEGAYEITLYSSREETDGEYYARIKNEEEMANNRKRYLEATAAAEIRLMHQLKQKYPNQW
jgi:hypothetical protein